MSSPSEENALSEVGVEPPRRQQGAVWVAHVFLLGAFACLAVARWHRGRMNLLREEYLRQHGVIDIPEALHFDGMAASVQVPVLLLWFGLQLASAATFCANRSGIGYAGRLLFWTLWLAAWGFCLL